MQSEDFLAILEAAALESGSIIHEYNLARDQDSEGIFAFFEGDEDKMFFIPHVRQRSGGKIIYSYICDGKDGVIDVMKELACEATRRIYFIDRDYDDFFNEKNSCGDGAFVTKWYSVENYLATAETIDIIWDDFITLPKDGRYRAFVADFTGKMDALKRTLLPITSWILASREAGDKLYLSRLKIDKLINVDGKCTPSRKKSALGELKRCAVDSGGVRNLNRWRNRISGRNFLEWARGKFVIWFLQTYLCSRIDAIRSSIPKGARTCCAPVGIMQKKLFETLGARLSCPAELDQYLQKALA